MSHPSSSFELLLLHDIVKMIDIQEYNLMNGVMNREHQSLDTCSNVIFIKPMCAHKDIMSVLMLVC